MYLFTPVPETFKTLDLPEDEDLMDHDCVMWGGKSKAATWKAPIVEWLEDDLSTTSGAVADFTIFGAGPLAVSSKAYETLKDLFKDQVEFLPIKGPSTDDHWQLLNVINLVDIMDATKSKYEIYSDGRVGGCTHAHLNEPTAENHIFKVKGWPTRTFISETAKQVIESAGLTGGLIRKYLNPD